jgi:hypothetical protein
MAGTFILIAPSTVLILVIPLPGTLSHDDLFYVTQTEYDALEWLEANATSDNVVLASPTYSLHIPAQAGARVVYGHPFETVQAETRQGAVLDYYAGDSCDLVADEGVDFVVYGPREERLGGGCLPDEEPIYISDDIIIYQTTGD